VSPSSRTSRRTLRDAVAPSDGDGGFGDAANPVQRVTQRAWAPPWAVQGRWPVVQHANTLGG